MVRAKMKNRCKLRTSIARKQVRVPHRVGEEGPTLKYKAFQKKIIDKSVVWEVVWVGIIALARILVPTITSQRSSSLPASRLEDL